MNILNKIYCIMDEYDYLLNTTNKTKKEIFKELQENVFDNNKFFRIIKILKQEKNYSNKYYQLLFLRKLFYVI